MTKKTKVMDLEHIVREVAAKTGGSIKDTSKVMDALLDVLSDNLQKGHTIHLADFGTLSTTIEKATRDQ